MLRFEDGEEKKPPAKALDLSKSVELSTPTGAARLTLLNTFLPIAVKDSEYFLGAACPIKGGRPPLLLKPPGPRPLLGPPGPPPRPPPPEGDHRHYFRHSIFLPPSARFRWICLCADLDSLDRAHFRSCMGCASYWRQELDRSFRISSG